MVLAIMRLLEARTARIHGEIRFEEQNLLELQEKEVCRIRGKRFAMIFQDPFSSLNPRMSVQELMDLQDEMGPIVSRGQVERILRYIEIGKAEGARLATGGHELTGVYAGGNCVEPTIFADCSNDTRIAQKEIFDPVLVGEKFSTEQETYDIANDSICGLGAGVYTRDVARTWRFTKEVKAVCRRVNTYGTGWHFCLLRQLQLQISVTYVYAPAALQWIAAAGSAP